MRRLFKATRLSWALVSLCACALRAAGTGPTTRRRLPMCASRPQTPLTLSRPRTQQPSTRDCLRTPVAGSPTPCRRMTDRTPRGRWRQGARRMEFIRHTTRTRRVTRTDDPRARRGHGGVWRRVCGRRVPGRDPCWAGAMTPPRSRSQRPFRSRSPPTERSTSRAPSSTAPDAWCTARRRSGPSWRASMRTAPSWRRFRRWAGCISSRADSRRTGEGIRARALSAQGRGTTLSGLTTPAPPTLTACVLAFDRTGALRWMLPLRNGRVGHRKPPVARRRRPPRARGRCRGRHDPRRRALVDAPSRRLCGWIWRGRCRAGVAHSGRASHGAGRAAINPSGRLSTLVDAPADDAGAASAARLTLWGTRRKAPLRADHHLGIVGARRRGAQLPHLARPLHRDRRRNLHHLPRPGWRAALVDSVHAARPSHGLDYPGVPGMTWLTVRGDALDLVTFRSQHEWYGSCAPAICTRRSVGIGIRRASGSTAARSRPTPGAGAGGVRRGRWAAMRALVRVGGPGVRVVVDPAARRGPDLHSQHARCPYGTELCDGACVDRASDPDHCGACGRRCDGSPPARRGGLRRGRLCVPGPAMSGGRAATATCPMAARPTCARTRATAARAAWRARRGSAATGGAARAMRVSQGPSSRTAMRGGTSTPRATWNYRPAFVASRR